jgi:hypothetical protein
MTVSYCEYEMNEYEMNKYEMSEYGMTISMTSAIMV